MKKEHIIFAGAVASIIMLIVMVAAAIEAYIKWQQYQPQIQQFANTAGNSSQLFTNLYSTLSNNKTN